MSMTAKCKHCGKDIYGGDQFPGAQWKHVGAWYQCHIGSGTFAELAQHVFEPYGAHPFCYWYNCGRPQDDQIHIPEAVT